MLKLKVERGEPILVPPADDTNSKGNLYMLSNFDYNFPRKISTVYCFNPTDGNKGNEVVEVIKNGLSKVLVPYYPMAGRLIIGMDGRPVLACTAEGAVFVDAKASCTIDEIGDDTVLMDQLVYDHTSAAKSILDLPPLTAQVTKFKNGGFALGICMNHLVLDGLAASIFINSWAEVARGSSLKVPPLLDRSILRARNPPKIEFPHPEFSYIEDISHSDVLYNEKILYKSFCFDHEKIEKLKMESMKEGIIVRCSTFQVLSAFIWQSRARSLKLQDDQKVKLLLIVDARSRFDPPLPENYFGNGVAVTSCLSTAGELSKRPFSYVVKLVQNAIQLVTNDYMKSAIDFLEGKKLTRSCAAVTFGITSWTKLSLDTTDFGWGQPFLVGPAYSPPADVVFLLSHPKEKKNFIFLLSLPASSMKIFEEHMDI